MREVLELGMYLDTRHLISSNGGRGLMPHMRRI